MRRKILLWSVLLALPLTVFLGAAVLLNRSPRELAPYIERRADGHNRIIVWGGQWLGKTLRALDRMDSINYALPVLKVGAQRSSEAALPSDRQLVLVASAAQARLAIAQAKPGQVISLLPGLYVFSGSPLYLNQAGLAHAPITLRARQAGTVRIELALQEGFIVAAPYWIFENLHVRGVCQVQENCEHAFHVVGNAHHFISRNNTLLDFNAHFKINMVNGMTPDDGLIEYTTLSNSVARRGAQPVTPVDLVGASRWHIRHNLISDFIKDGGDRISYGVFAKGGGFDNRIAQNMIICEHRLQGQAGQRVGISLGGGGTGAAYCREQRCLSEQERGVIEANLVMACSDDGIYLNKAANSRIIHNTLLDTGGIQVRFPESSADIFGNMVDGRISVRDGGVLRAAHNLDSNLASIFLGYHRQRYRLRDPAVFDLSWRARPDALPVGMQGVSDLCGAHREKMAVPGAFNDFMDCLQTEGAIRP